MAKKHTSDISQSTTQLFLDLYDITNDLIILGDGATSLVITVSAMNFGLLSEGEQDATIYAYAALLNSLSFPIEIVIRSQPKDVTSYLKKIQDLEETTSNPTYKQKIKEYRSFVESLVQDQNVLDKKFYIIIPLSAVEMGLTTQSVVPGAKSKPLSSFEKNYIIEKAKTNLIPRRDHLIDQLARIGLYSRQLTTQELIQMLYSSYNPESFEGLKVTDTSNYTTPLVQAKIQGDFMFDPTAVPNTPQSGAVGTMQANPAPAAPPPVMAAPATQAPQTLPPTMAASSAPFMSNTPTPQPMTPSMSSVTDSSVTPVAEGTTSVAPTTVPEMPEFVKTDLGFSTPAQMSSTMNSTPTMSAPSMGAPTAQSTGVQPSEPVNTPLAESPVVSTPASPGSEQSMASTTQPAVDDPQSLINQTLNQVSPAPATSMPMSMSPGITRSATPGVNSMPTTMPVTGVVPPSTES